MISSAERWQRIFTEPLDYLHAQRLTVPSGFQTPDARRVLNQIVLEGLSLQGPWPPMPQTAIAVVWVRQWRQLPRIALLMGAWRLFPQLARGGALQHLPESLRRFASCNPGPRINLPIPSSFSPIQQVEAAGFNALSGWRDCLPPPLLDRLALQFSAQVIDLHKQWPVAEPDPTLFFLAVQHARLHPNPD